MENINHKLVVTYIKEDKIETFKEELTKYLNSNDLRLVNMESWKSQIYFDINGNMEQIKLFIKEFASKWDIREMGVSEFARIMEISDTAAEEWYRDISKYCWIIKTKLDFEGDFVHDVLKIDNIEKLRYLKGHFSDNMESLIQDRINYLEGKKDDYYLWMERQLEKQNILDKLEKINVNEGTATILEAELQDIIKYIKSEE